MSQYLRNGRSAHAELDVRGSFIMEHAGISPLTPASADKKLFNKVTEFLGNYLYILDTYFNTH